MLDIKAGSVFINSNGNTIKIEKIEGHNAYFTVDGKKKLGFDVDSISNVKNTLEKGSYKDISSSFSSFFMPKSKVEYIIGASVGEKITNGGPEGYWAEIIKKDERGIHVKFSTSDCQNSTMYLYEENGFDFKNIFTPEVYISLAEKFNVNVFEVIGVARDNGSMQKEGIVDCKFTVLGKTINKELLDKIDKAYPSALIYQIKRLTNVTIQ